MTAEDAGELDPSSDSAAETAMRWGMKFRVVR